MQIHEWHESETAVINICKEVDIRLLAGLIPRCRSIEIQSCYPPPPNILGVSTKDQDGFSSGHVQLCHRSERPIPAPKSLDLARPPGSESFLFHQRFPAK